MPKKPSKLPLVPTEAEIKRFYEVVWQSNRFSDLIIIKTFLYTGVRVGERVNIRLADVDFALCQIRINGGKGNRDPLVVFPSFFKEALAMHHQAIRVRWLDGWVVRWFVKRLLPTTKPPNHQTTKPPNHQTTKPPNHLGTFPDLSGHSG